MELRIRPCSCTEVRPMSAERRVRLCRNGRHQMIRIPPAFEVAGREALLRKDGDRLVIEPLKRKSLLALLATWKRLREKLLDVDRGLRPADDVAV